MRDMDSKGALHVLRHGFRFQGKTLRIAHFRPAHGLNPDTVQDYERNELTVTRQARCHPKGNDTVDLLFALNGVPVATCELKNPQTDQTWRDAVVQYQKDRNPNAPLFKFKKRALVHFAVDPDEVHMTTLLAKSKTRFLPFNRGSDPGAMQCGAGNPPDPLGYRTRYFWQEVLQRDRFMDILGSCIFVETRSETVYDNGETRSVEHEAVVFPRYHQLDALDNLIETVRSEGPGHNYLVQHSAGSGKTNTISWLAHRLSTLHEGNEKIFDGVVVITDRRSLDNHLQNAVYQIDHQQGVVKKIDRDSKQLAQALADKTPIVITTLQKFPFVLQGMLSVAAGKPGGSLAGSDEAEAERLLKAVAGRRYAMIVDEAHSSQTGETARAMKEILGERTSAVEVEDWQDGLNAVVASRGHQPNLSFFAFTATPKGKTIELFGRKKGAGSEPEPFHVYSMRQAIEEGFILDVLRNYTTYKTFFHLVQTADQDEDFPKRRTAVALSKFVATHAFNISQKTEVIIEHFREHIRHRIGGKAKAMVVTSGRLPAVRYMQAFERYIAENKYTGRACADRVQRHRHRPRLGRGVHRASHEHQHQIRRTDQRGVADCSLRLARLPDPARGREVPDRLRPAAAAGDVCGQAPQRGADRADPVAAQPGGRGQREPVRARLRQRVRRHQRGVRPLLRPDATPDLHRPVPPRCPQAPTRRGAGLSPRRGGDLRRSVLQASA